MYIVKDAMIRTQIYLTEHEHRALSSLSVRTGKTLSQLIRDAVDRSVESLDPSDRRALLRKGRGLWKARVDLPDFTRMRCEIDRFTPPGRGDR